ASLPQLLRPEMFADTADKEFYRKYAQSGIERSLKEGLSKEFKDSGLGTLKDTKALANAIEENPKQAAEAIVKSVWPAISGLPRAVKDGFVEAGNSIGEGAAVAFDPEIQAKLNDIYGTDISGLQNALLAIRVVTSVTGASAAGKAGGEVAEATTKAVVKQLDEIKAAKLAAEAEQKARDARTAELNANRDAEGFGQSSQRDFEPGKTHRAENINAGQVTDRDGFPHIDDDKKFKDEELKKQTLGGDLPYWNTQRPAWKEGTIVIDKVLDKPRTMTMTIDAGQYEKMLGQRDLGNSPATALGGWATDTPINSLADVRNKLAVPEDFKSGQLYQVEITVKPGVGVREGVVGDMWDPMSKVRLSGGGHQVNFMDKAPRTHPELYDVNMNSVRPLQ
ncbi:MAG: hypothetical protein ACREXR_18525, partial [Gammaproteobacteria bacterium]